MPEVARVAPFCAMAPRRTSVTAPLGVLHQGAAARCPGLPWTVRAAIGTMESDNGQSERLGIRSGASAGPKGPQQLEPATFSERHSP